MTLVVINIDSNDGRVARLEAKRFEELSHHAGNRSVILGYPLGIRVNEQNNSYFFLVFQNGWRQIESEETFRRRTVAVPCRLELVYPEDPEGEASAETGVLPHIVVEPDGLVSIFEIEFVSEDERYRVKTNVEREIVVSQVEDD